MELIVKFKGDRDYIQGPDIFNEVNRVCSHRYGDGYARYIEFKSFSKGGVSVVPECKIRDRSQICGKVIYALDRGQDLKFFLCENGKEITTRVSYYEDEIVSDSIVDRNKKSITSPDSPQASHIELIVALNKLLNYEIWPAPAGKWVFTRVSLEQDLDRCVGDCRLEISRAIANRFTEALVIFNGVYVGKITFTVAP